MLTDSEIIVATRAATRYSIGTASTGASNAMNSTHGTALTQEPLWGLSAGP
jgi:hypothetical protein